MPKYNRRKLLSHLVALGAWAGIKTATGAIRTGSPSSHLSDVWSNLFGNVGWEESDRIRVQVPEIAEDGAVVPITVETDWFGSQELFLLVERNPQPLAAHAKLGERSNGYLSLRLKLNETGQLWVVARRGDTCLAKMLKVTVLKGGCG